MSSLVLGLSHSSITRPSAGSLRHDVPVTNAATLVRRAQVGDEHAFRTLYQQHAGAVFAVCVRLSADGVLAAELTQDVFVRAWEGLASFRGESAFSTWLHRIAVNVVLAHQRTAERRERRVSLPGDLELESHGVDGPSAAESIDLERAIAKLPTGARTVFVLYDIEGYSHADIASLTGIAEGTSKAQLFRARRLLREALK